LNLVFILELKNVGVKLRLARDDSLKIADVIMLTAAHNSRSSKAVMKLRLARGADNASTKAFAMAGRGDYRDGKEVMKQLLARDTGIDILTLISFASPCIMKRAVWVLSYVPIHSKL
jgi:hypothetical protein